MATPNAPPPRAPTHAERARTLAAQARSATLSTLARDPEGYPFGTLVTVAFDPGGRALLLLSTLAEHTQNLARSASASLLLTEHADASRPPLSLARVTIVGPCQPISDEDRDEAKAIFLAAHPDASTYIGFKDFALYRLAPIALRYVGGFGRMSWVSIDDYLAASPDPLAPT